MVCEGNSAEWFMEFCKYEGNRYIFGTGTQAVNTLFLLELLGESIDGVIVSDVKVNTFKGLHVYGLKDISDKGNSTVLLAVGEKVSREVIGQIEENGFRDIFLCTDWESANDLVKEKVFIDYLDEKGIDYSGNTIELNKCRFFNPLRHPRCYRQMLMGTAFSEIILPAIMRDDRYGSREAYELIEERLSGGKQVIDVGANAGVFSVYASGFAERVIAIDASRAIFPYLSKNADLAGNIKVLQFVVGDADGMAVFYDREDYPKYSGTTANELATKYEEKARSLDSIVDEFGLVPDFIRIDVGSDAFKVISGGIRVIERCNPGFMICGLSEIEDDVHKVLLTYDYKYERTNRGIIYNKKTM